MSGLTTSTATEQPWKQQIPYLTAGFKQAQELLDAGMPPYYGDPTLAQFTGPETAAQQNIINYAGGDQVRAMQDASANQLLGTYNLANQLAQQASGYGGAAAQDAQARANAVGAYGGGLMDYGRGATRYGMSQGQYAGMTPFQDRQLSEMLAGDVDVSSLVPVLGAMGRDVMGEIQGNILPGIRSQQVQYQPGGSSRGDIVTSNAITAANQRMIDNASRMYADAYSQAQGRRLPAAQMALGAQQAAQQLGTQGAQLGLGAGSLAQQGYGTGLQGVQAAQGAGQLGLSALGQYPGIMQAPLSMYGAAGQVGAQQRAMNQETINQAMAKYNYGAMAPQQALQNYMSMISGQYGGQSTATPSPLSSLGQLVSLVKGGA
tara:strand:+ start:753 stop:1877 length:1125 start_codon:yes stop_codon:yes gene_type:complete